MKLKIAVISLIAAMAVTFSFVFTVNSQAADISSKLIRLHVVANSDSEEDQSLKLAVRDEILDYLSPKLKSVSDREEAVELVESEIGSIKKIAEDKIKSLGYDYAVKITLRTETFPTTQYSTFSLPAGEYLSLRVIIGDGAGHNWWCVVFPPVCTVTEFDETLAKSAGLTDDEIALITYESDSYAVKFKVLELLSKLKSKIH
jgi:stage II sporulation protein R